MRGERFIPHGGGIGAVGCSGTQAGVSKHQADTVFLIDARSARIVIDRHDVGRGKIIFDFSQHAFADDVIGQAAKWLGAHNVVDAAIDEFQHFAGQQPAFAHFVAVTAVAFYQGFQMVEGAGCSKPFVRLDGVDHILLKSLDKPRENTRPRVYKRFSTVQLMVGDAVVAFEQNKIRYAGYHGLASLREQKAFQPIVAERRVFDIDFTDNADERFVCAMEGDGSEILGNGAKVFPNMLAAKAALLRKFIGKTLDPFVHAAIGFALDQLIGAALVGHMHNQIAVQHGKSRLAGTA